MVVTADDLLLGGLLTDFIVNDAFAHHIDAHVRRGFVGAVSVDSLKNSI